MPAPVWPPFHPRTPLAVLASGGLDSSVLLAEAAEVYPKVVPIFVRVGSLWESTERESLQRFVDAIHLPSVQPVVELEQPVSDLYGDHWSLTGRGVPLSDAPDEDTFLPGRNVLLFAKPLIWCAMNGVEELATAPLASNPFPDATAAFYDGMAETVTRAMARPLRILRPFAAMGLHKHEVIRRGRRWPLELTFSCAQPVQGRNCGRCNKCAERQQGFHAAGVPDPTVYAG